MAGVTTRGCCGIAAGITLLVGGVASNADTGGCGWLVCPPIAGVARCELAAKLTGKPDGVAGGMDGPGVLMTAGGAACAETGSIVC